MAPLPTIFEDPVALALLTLAVAAVLYWQRTLSWTEYRQFHRLKVRFLPILDRHTNLFVVSRKGTPEEDAEYVTHIGAPVPEVFRRLVAGGGSPHLINSIKVRPHPSGTGEQYSAAHVVFTHSDGTQTEVYLFGGEGGVTHAYAHHEVGVGTPEEHYENADQQDGDPRGVVREALGVE